MNVASKTHRAALHIQTITPTMAIFTRIDNVAAGTITANEMPGSATHVTALERLGAARLNRLYVFCPPPPLPHTHTYE